MLGDMPSAFLSDREPVLSIPVAKAILSVAVVACSLGSVAPVAAQSEDDKENARRLFQEGVTLFNRGQFVEACPKFEESLALFAGVGTRGKLAECYERSGRTASAWRLYLEVEKLARQMNDPQRAKVAAQRAKVLKARLARLTIKPGPSFELDGFKIERDKIEQPPRTFDIPVVVDPGSYRIRAVATGHKPWSGTVRLGEGEARTVKVPALVPDGLIPGDNDTTDNPSGSESSQTDRPRPGRRAGIALLGVGAAILAVGTGYSGIRAIALSDRVDGDCLDDPNACNDPGESENRTDLVTAIRWANVTAAIGGVTAAAGVYLWWRSTKRTAARQDERAWLFTPAVGPHSIGVAFSGRM